MSQKYRCDKCINTSIDWKTTDELITAVQGHMRDIHQLEIATSPQSTPQQSNVMLPSYSFSIR